MKKIFILAAFALLSVGAYAQDDAQKAAAEAAAAIAEAPIVEEPQPKPVYWTKTLMTNVNFAQTALWDWAAGGNDNYTMTGYLDANANYAKEKMIWNNRLQVDYGFLYSDDKPILQKVKDRIYFESKWGYETPIQHLSYSANYDFKTQIDNNYNYKTPTGITGEPTKADWKAARELKSGLLSPAYSTLGVGLLWTPKPWLSINASPLTGGFVIVQNEELRKAYGMELRDLSAAEQAAYDAAVTAGTATGSYYKSSRFELGAQVKTDINFTVNDNLKYTTQLVLFSNYLKNPQNIRVNWDQKLFWKMAKFFTLTFSTNLIYDDTVLITNDEHPNGFRTIQFKEFFEIGFSYTISSKK
ncbi:MAG: DUF3078 domain-containing protein [Bacteroidales bacterium]|nr:DUF3078 domain-containing protein [Bacteroidales bacterium]